MTLRPFESRPLANPTPHQDGSNGRIQGSELFKALRGIWQLEGQELVIDIDQETGELMACTYEGEKIDPRSVITPGAPGQALRKAPDRELRSWGCSMHLSMRGRE
jgi:hypothetical protein